MLCHRIPSAFALLLLLAATGPAWAEEDGFVLDPNDGVAYVDSSVPLRLSLRGLVAGDYRHYDRRNSRGRGATLDRALFGAEGQLFERLSFRVLADAKGIDTNYGLEEAWLSFEVVPRWLRITAGVLRIPLGIEHSFPEETLPFVDYGLPAFLAGRTDLAVRLEGELEEGLFSYDVVLACGEGFDMFGQRRDDPQVSGRLVSYPFRWLDLTVDLGPYQVPLLSGFFLSLAGVYSDEYRGHPEFATSLRNQLVFTPRLEADASWFWQGGYGFDLGPFRFTHEFGRGTLLDLLLPDGTRQDLENKFSSWAASLAWRITGEPFDSRPYRQRDRPAGFPARPLYEDGAWGPGTIEVAVRYANGEIDRDLIELGITSGAIAPTFMGISSQEFRTFDAALNWYPFRSVRLTVQVTRTIADQRPAEFDSHGRDTSVAARLQLWF